MDAFVWDERFTTGLTRVDDQHHHLVDLVNKVGDYLIENRKDEAALQAVFGELATYALEHFAEEERLMAECRVDARHAERHARHHRNFVDQLTSMWERRHSAADPAATLHAYLASWLTVHILGEDQVMARMIAAIRSGVDPARAFESENISSDQRVSPLLEALHKLYHVLSVQNRDLAEANLTLENKVAVRTAELESERADLKRALAHVEQAHQQLLQNEKMASLGRMVAGFAHELNTPVGIAIGAVSNGEEVIRQTESMLAGDEVSAEDLQSRLDEMREGNQLALANLQRAAELVQRLKRSSIDQDGLARRRFNVAETVDDVLLHLKPRFQECGVEIDAKLDRSLVVDGQPGLYEQVLTSLIGNSLRHAYGEGKRGGVIRIEVLRDDEDWLCLSVADDGAGLAPEIADRLFEPFVTTQRGSGRLGLGLYLCYNVVTTKLGGEIRCQSSAGKGTCFFVRIPLVGPGAEKQ